MCCSGRLLFSISCIGTNNSTVKYEEGREDSMQVHINEPVIDVFGQIIANNFSKFNLEIGIYKHVQEINHFMFLFGG